MGEIEFATTDRINKLPASYRKAKIRAELKKMDTKSLMELAKIDAELLARYQTKQGSQRSASRKSPSKKKALTERLRDRSYIYPSDTRIGALIRDSDLTVAKSYVRALCE